MSFCQKCRFAREVVLLDEETLFCLTRCRFARRTGVVLLGGVVLLQADGVINQSKDRAEGKCETVEFTTR